ncbi:MAG: hypothetical protein SGJ24_07780 [Chloroflexota bacterium]|nr:hypothetical protein [Chloroflexota bacterium]
MAQMNAAPVSWHVGNWGTWGWIETGLKGVGIAAGIIALVGALGSDAPLMIGDNPELGAIILIALISLFYVFGIILRIMQKEVISVIYMPLAALGHLGVLLSLLRTPAMLTLPLILGIFFILGEAAKNRFLVTSGFTEAGMDSKNMIRGALGVLIFYVVYVVFLLI